MSLYKAYLNEIKDRKKNGLSAKPIDSGDLTKEIVFQIKDKKNPERNNSVNFLIYNTLPGTTPSAKVKADFLKEIIIGEVILEEITPAFALELLSHMKGGPSIDVLLDLSLGDNKLIAKKAAEILKSQVFLYKHDTDRLVKSYQSGNEIAKEVLQSYSKAEFFTKRSNIQEEIKIVTYVAAEGDISTDLLSPGNHAHSRSDRELHGNCFISKTAQKEITELKELHPDKRIMLVAEKGTMGVGSSRMSGINNVALWTGKKSSPYIPFINFFPIVAGTNGISPIFMTTVGVTGGIGIDLKNWAKKRDEDGNIILNNDGEPILEQIYSVDTGTILIINTKKKKLYTQEGQELIDISSSFTPQKMEFIKAGSSYSIVFGKKLQSFASNILSINTEPIFAQPKEVVDNGSGLTAVEKIFNNNAIDIPKDTFFLSGSDVRVKVNIIGSQDTTGLMTSQELEAMAATTISDSVDGAYQSGCLSRLYGI